MITQEQIEQQAVAATLNSDFGDDFTAGFRDGAMWANKANAAGIAELEAEKAELLTVLRMLYDEQNDAPLERRRAQWQLAMDECKITLQKLEK